MTASPGTATRLAQADQQVVTPCRSCNDDPAAVLNGSILARQGWYVVERLLAGADVQALAAEATAQHRVAEVQHTARPIDEATGPRGQPARWLESAVGGPLLEAFYNTPELRSRLAALTGLQWQPSGSNATYSYYRAPGHHLDLHRDVDACDLAIITCLYRSGEHVPSLELFTHAGHLSLDSIRSTMPRPSVAIDLAVGESLILLGGFVAHRLAPLGPGQVRIVAPMCFTVLH